MYFFDVLELHCMAKCLSEQTVICKSLFQLTDMITANKIFSIMDVLTIL